MTSGQEIGRERDVKSNGSVKRAAWVVWIILILSVIPVLLLAFCAFPCADDFSYGLETARCVAQGENFGEILSVAAKQTASIYRSWQGSFSAVFLMQLQPAAFGEKFYPLTTFLMLLALVGGTMLLFWELLVKRCGALKGEYFLLTGAVLFLTINGCYFPAEGFYWFNGAVYYTFFYGLGLMLLALTARAARVTGKGDRLFSGLAAAILAVVVAGGNYTTALSCFLLLGTALVWALLQKNRMFSISFLLLLAITLLFGGSFLFSILAPGNGVRQAAVGGAANPILAIFLSFVLGGYIFLNSLTFPVVLAFACITPVVYRIAKRTGFSFPVPVLFSGFSLCLFCAQCAPPLYALGINVPERLLNIIYFSFYPLILINLLYWCGWFAKKGIPDFGKAGQLLKQYSGVVLSCGVILVLLTSVGACKISKGENGAEITGLPFYGEAVLELANGSARQFREENIIRFERCQQSAGEQVTFREFTEKPYLLYTADISSDPSDWRNRAVSDYFGLESVTLEK